MKFTSYKKYINEKFTQDSDPVNDLRIGARKLIEDWIEEMNKKYGILATRRPYGYWIDVSINNDNTIDAFSINISWPNLSKLPSYIKFNHIRENFICCFDNIKTIKSNGPKRVDGMYKIFISSKKSVPFSKKDIREICNCKDIKIINDVKF